MSSGLRQLTKRMAKAAREALPPQMTIVGSDGRRATCAVPSMDAAAESRARAQAWDADMARLYSEDDSLPCTRVARDLTVNQVAGGSIPPAAANDWNDWDGYVAALLQAIEPGPPLAFCADCWSWGGGHTWMCPTTWPPEWTR